MARQRQFMETLLRPLPRCAGQFKKVRLVARPAPPYCDNPSVTTHRLLPGETQAEPS
jgi:hypothetical protein